MNVWEIGPGIGAMTKDASETGARMILFEIDYGFCALLKDLYEMGDSMTLIEGDVLKTWKAARDQFPKPERVFGNLPYNVGSVFIARLIDENFLPERMVYTLQREVAVRLTASPGTKIYSSFTLLCGLDYEVSVPADIGRDSFYPSPDIVSSIVRFDRKASPLLEGEPRRIYLTLIRELFSSRRKTIRNNIKQGSLKQTYDPEGMLDVFSALGIADSRRAETISLEEMTEAAKGIAAMGTP